MDKELALKLADLEEKTFLALVQQELEAGTDTLAIIEACREGMTLVGKRFEEGRYFISDLMMSSAMFKQASEILSPHLKTSGDVSRGKVVMGTVKGDIHNIGKDIVVEMLKSANYDVHDLGVDVPPERFVEVIKETKAQVLGLSALLTTAFESMKDTVEALKAAGLRSQARIMIGGGVTNQEIVEYTGSDAWGANAQMAVNLCNTFMEAGK